MTTLYAVIGTTGGYAREDSPSADIVGIYSTDDVAQKVAKVGFGYKVVPVELDYIHLGHLEFLRQIGVTF